MVTMNKLVLSTDGFVSAYNRVPNEAEFLFTITKKAVRFLIVLTP